MSTDSVLQLVDPHEFARCLFEESNDALLLFDPSTLRLVGANPSAQRLMGIAHGPLLARTIPRLFAADDAQLLNEFLESCRLGKLFQSREAYQLLRDGGDPLDVNVTLSHLHLPSSLVGVISLRDVSDRRQLESNLRSTQLLLMATIDNQASNLDAATAELRESQQRMRELLDDVGAVVWEADLPGIRFTYVSNRAQTVLGYPTEQWLEEPSFWINHLHPEDVETAQSLYDESICRGKDQEFDYRALTADGRVVWIRNTMHVVKDDNGDPIKLRGVMTDITTRVEANQKLQLLERDLAHVSRLSTLGAMVAGIAHEVNQPLAAISNFASAAQNELNSSGVPAESPLAEWMQQIREQAVRCGDIIRGLREFTRKVGTQQDTVEMERVIRDSITVLHSILQQQSVNLEISLPKEPVRVRGNATELQQVMVNLISNACESVAEAKANQPSICIGGRIQEDRLIISVVDNGTGIAPDILPRLFDPFFTTRPNGLGIGLAISRTIIENHGGKLMVVADHSPGACLRFELPLWNPDGD